MTDPIPYDSLLVVSFGGPEGPDDVLPFLENVLRGKNVPRDRMEQVAEHYQHFGGVSPINGQVRELIAALEQEFASGGIKLPIYWGNRNWNPMLDDTVRQMTADGVQRSLAFITSAYSCYSGCRQYRENIQSAQQAAGDRAPVIEKLRMFFNHPLFIEAITDHVAEELSAIPVARRRSARLLFTAHSIPTSMADGCNYEKQLTEASRLVAGELNERQLGEYAWELVYQSRSGPPFQPWLEPDVCDRLQQLASQGAEDVVIIPIGFLSDHMEVLFDLDVEAREACEKLGIHMRRAKSVGTHPKFVAMIAELVFERMQGTERVALGTLGPSHDVCPQDCCLPGTSGRPL